MKKFTGLMTRKRTQCETFDAMVVDQCLEIAVIGIVIALGIERCQQIAVGFVSKSGKVGQFFIFAGIGDMRCGSQQTRIY